MLKNIKSSHTDYHIPQNVVIMYAKTFCMADDRAKYNNFELLVGRHCGLIRKLCWWRSSGNEVLCDDFVQECYLAIWQHLDTLRPNVAKLQEAAWVVWQCRSVFSHGDREITLPTTDESLFDHLPAPDANEIREILDDLAQILTPEEQSLFALMRQDLTDGEIAELLHLKLRTVREKQRQIINKLRQHSNNQAFKHSNNQ